MTQRTLPGLRKAHWLVGCYLVGILASVTIPAALVFLPLRPDGEALNSWIQRSGAVMVVLALLTEFSAISLNQLLNPSFYPEKGIAEARNRYKKFPVWMSVIVIVVSGSGTLINSYGDIVLELTPFFEEPCPTPHPVKPYKDRGNFREERSVITTDHG